MGRKVALLPDTASLLGLLHAMSTLLSPTGVGGQPAAGCMSLFVRLRAVFCAHQGHWTCLQTMVALSARAAAGRASPLTKCSKSVWF